MGSELPKLLEGYVNLRELDLSINHISDEDLVPRGTKTSPHF